MQKVAEKKKTLKNSLKLIKKSIKPENIFKFIIIVTSFAIIASSFLPYIIY